MFVDLNHKDMGIVWYHYTKQSILTNIVCACHGIPTELVRIKSMGPGLGPHVYLRRAQGSVAYRREPSPSTVKS